MGGTVLDESSPDVKRALFLLEEPGRLRGKVASIVDRLQSVAAD